MHHLILDESVGLGILESEVLGFSTHWDDILLLDFFLFSSSKTSDAMALLPILRVSKKLYCKLARS